MNEKKKFDLVVIGSGPGGYPAAIRAAQRGKKVALIEGRELGGTCLNRGCIPSKALIAGVSLLEDIRHAGNFGIHVESVSIDYAALVDRKDKVVAKIRKSLEGLIRANGIEIITGYATFTSPKKLEVSGKTPCTIETDQVIIAARSEPRTIPTFPFDGKKILDSTDILNLKILPKKLLIVGGGVIGCEFASLFRLLGVEITILEMLPSILPMECSSVSSALTKAFQAKGIEIYAGVKVESIKTTPTGIQAILDSKKTYEADLALIAVGRQMNLGNLGLDKAGVQLKFPAEIAVNDQMETNIPGIYAVGDVASKWWLAHVATHQGLVAADNACGVKSKMHYNAIPNVIFTLPEIATVGISLDEAKKQGFDAAIGQFPFMALGKAQAADHTEGFARIVIDNKTGQILGAQVVGYDASNLIAEMALAIQNELTIESIQETIHAHPTQSEAWLEAALIATGIPVHLPKANR
jgi:dihydrolipoamide dehydrogenase